MIDGTPAPPVPAKSAVELQALRGRVNAHAEIVLKEKFAESQLPDHSYKLPQFSLEEVHRGKYLGKGFFGMVYEVQGLDGGRSSRDGGAGGTSSSKASSKRPTTRKASRPWLCSGGKQQVVNNTAGFDESEDDDNDDDFLGDEDDVGKGTEDALDPSIRKQEARRTFMRAHCQRENGQTRYALKILRQEILKDPTKLYYQGVMDLQSETRLLSSIQHPHIIKLRGIAQNTKCHEEYFLIMDRLYQVLDDRLQLWQRQFQRWNGMVGKLILDRHGHQLAQLWQDRLVAAHDLASALGYLHSRRIIHRDLKCDNIGFDIRGDLKLFDMGLARELPPASKATPRHTWHMTGSTGTPRYMSPEVALDKDYNESCDTYSYCMLLWELLALKTPFELYSMKSFIQRVWNSPHKRPQLDPTWPKPIHKLLQSGWHPDLNERPPMTELVEILRLQVVQCRKDADQRWGLDVLAHRRSTHVYIEEDDDVDKSHKSGILSLLSSPFHSKKSPFRLGGSNNPNGSKSSGVTFGGNGSKSSLYSKSPYCPPTDKSALPLDMTKATAIMAVDDCMSPTQLDLSGSNSSYVSAASPPHHRHVQSLPMKPPLMDDDDDDDNEEEESIMEIDSQVPLNDHDQNVDASNYSNKFENQAHLHASPNSTTSGNTAIWQRLEEARAGQDKIRQRLSATAAQ